MKDIDVILHSEYIIDGQRMDSTPAQMLGECTVQDAPEPPDTTEYILTIEVEGQGTVLVQGGY